MKPQEIIQKIERVGHISVVDNSRLRIEVPPGYLTKEDKQILREKKKEVIHHLQAMAKPYLDERGVLVIPFNCDPKYKWWQGGQQVMETLQELNAPPEIMSRYAPGVETIQ